MRWLQALREYWTKESGVDIGYRHNAPSPAEEGINKLCECRRFFAYTCKERYLCDSYGVKKPT